MILASGVVLQLLYVDVCVKGSGVLLGRTRPDVWVGQSLKILIMGLPTPPQKVGLPFVGSGGRGSMRTCSGLRR